MIIQNVFINPGIFESQVFEEATYFENIRCHYDNSYYHNYLYNAMKYNEPIEKKRFTYPSTSASEN